MLHDRVVILGASLAGVFVAKYLALERIPHVEIEIIHCGSQFEFSPCLPEVIAGSLSSKTLGITINKFLKKAKITLAQVEAIDYERCIIDLLESDSGKTRRLEYDHLVIALDHLQSRIPKDRDYRIVQSFDEAEKFRDHIRFCLHKAEGVGDAKLRAQLLRFIVVGGGSGGVEIIAAIRHLVQSTIRSMPSIQLSECQFVIVEQRERLLPKFPSRFSRFAARKLKALGIDVLNNSRVVDYDSTSLEILNRDKIEAQTIVATYEESSLSDVPGLSMIATDGKIQTDEFLRVKSRRNVWAVGYAANIPLIPKKKQGFTVAPDTPQFALQEAWQVSQNIAAEYKGWNVSSMQYMPLVFFSGTGAFRAIGSICGCHFSGAPGAVLRMIRLLIWLPGFKRKLKLLGNSLGLFRIRE